ncbi:transmembrane protein 201 isoform X2 [Anolis sagrei]|uniref:transmembrane protein 201 isoform X2 n=1 Tax=Anolis sagrei TaxID=38937 RepID=UPI0035226283
MEGLGLAWGAFPATATAAAGIGAAAAGGAWLYHAARRRKPTHMTVNCWFCSQDTVVPYGNRNCWDCPNCEQYNGFQENGDYNKPIPAQYMEHLNHVVSGTGPPCDPSRPQQWVSSQVLLCKKCNNHQTTKIKQLASFTPREEGKYDEEIEVYKHHLEQTYKLCRPCQAAVEYYIKHQNRQLRALLLRHHFSHRKADKTYMQSFYAAAASSSSTTPFQVVALRFLAFLVCAVLLFMASYGSGNPFAPETASAPAPPSPASGKNRTEGVTPSNNGTLLDFLRWQEVMRLLPEGAMEALGSAWDYGKSHQTAVVVIGLLTCFLAMLLAGRIRLRRIDAFASVLWLLVMGFHLAESYLQADPPTWMDTAKFGTTSLCCLVGFAAAVATRKPAGGQRRPRPRRHFSDDAIPIPLDSGAELGFAFPPPLPSPAAFFPARPYALPFAPPLFRSPRRTSSSSLPGRLNRALSLGTTPSLARTDSGYLFSGSRPPSQMSFSKESPTSEYFSLFSGSCFPSPAPSPAPSVAGSVASSSGSLRYRRPLISPARLNLKGQRLMLFTTQNGVSSGEDFAPSENHDLPTFPKRNHIEREMHDPRAVLEAGSLCSEGSAKKRDDSSHGSSCVVDTTTNGEESAGWKGRVGCWSLRGLLAVSLTLNAVFTSAFLYRNLR